MTTTTAIVLGVESQIGLAILRELGRAGVRVVAISDDPQCIGFASKYVARRIRVDGHRSPEVIAAVNDIAREFGPVSLMTVSEANLMWLDSVRGAFAPPVRLAVPTATVMAGVLDKSCTLRAAQKVGIDTPITFEPESMLSIEQAAKRIRYPAVLKWKDVNAVAPRLGKAGLPIVKAEFVHDRSQLLSVAARYASIGEWPLVQEYCPGHGLGQFYFMHEGKAVRAFQHRRVAEWPPQGGYSAVCDSLPMDEHTELQSKSVALLGELGWEGVAMVEYRHDPKTGRSMLMEINGRFWGSLPLAVAAGAGFVRLAHAAALGGHWPELGPVTPGLRCRMVAAEVKRLHRIIFQPERISDPAFRRQPAAELLRFFGDFVRPQVCYFVWATDDPAPLWRDVRNATRPRQ